MNNSKSKAWGQFEAGKDYKRRIGLYSTVRQNERFYRGDQWYGISCEDLTKPVFNVIKRVVDYLICAITPQKVSISYIDERLPYISGSKTEESSKRITSILGANAKYRWERSKMDSKLYKLVLDAAISGDGVLYCYWKSNDRGDGVYEGDIETDVVDNVNFFVSDVNKNDIQTQEYIVLSGRASVLSLKREAKENGVCESDISRIVPDQSDDREKSGDLSAYELDGDDEAKATYIIKFWREDGKVCFEKSTRDCVISRARTMLTLYPVAYFNWHPTKNSFHGTSAVSGMIANQKYINRAYAMVMKHMSNTAFSKVIYDKSRIPEWSNEVGEAIAALGGTNVSDAVSVLGVGKLQDKYLEFLSNVIAVTKELGGATETALGNVNPQNTSAILAVQEASRMPLMLVRAALYRCIEDLACIWADMSIAYYASERRVPELLADGSYTSSELGESYTDNMALRAYVDVVDTSTYSASITLSILDRLLENGHISLSEYLERIPKGYIEGQTELKGGNVDE